jgi:uncharacterized membrane protein
MTIRRSLAAQGLLLAATVAYSFAIGAQMPDRVVIHWNLAGQPDGWGSKWTLLLLMPIVQATMALLTVALPALSPRQFEVQRSGRTYGWVMFVVALLMAAMHVVLLLKTSGATFEIGRAMLTVLFAFWILLGNVIGKVQRNFYMGIRTPWTLASERVWHATHRAAGRLWVAGGAIGLLAALCGAPLVALLVLLLVVTLTPVPQSYLIYRKMEQ